MLYTDEGFVLRVRDILNEDKVINLLLKDTGLVSSIAKGAKKITSRKTGKLEMLSLSKFSLAKGKSLDILLEIKTLKSYPSAREKFLYPFFLLSELVENFAVGFTSADELFQLLSDVLDWLDTDDCQTAIPVLIYFCTRFFLIEGILPDMYVCSICGIRFVADEEKVWYGGSFLHRRCSRGDKVQDTELKLLRYFALQASTDKAMQITAPREVWQQVFSLTMNMVVYTIGKPLHAQQYVKC